MEQLIRQKQVKSSYYTLLFIVIITLMFSPASFAYETKNVSEVVKTGENSVNGIFSKIIPVTQDEIYTKEEKQPLLGPAGACCANYFIIGDLGPDWYCEDQGQLANYLCCPPLGTPGANYGQQGYPDSADQCKSILYYSSDSGNCEELVDNCEIKCCIEDKGEGSTKRYECSDVTKSECEINNASGKNDFRTSDCSAYPDTCINDIPPGEDCRQYDDDMASCRVDCKYCMDSGDCMSTCSICTGNTLDGNNDGVCDNIVVSQECSNDFDEDGDGYIDWDGAPGTPPKLPDICCLSSNFEDKDDGNINDCPCPSGQRIIYNNAECTQNGGSVIPRNTYDYNGNSYKDCCDKGTSTIPDCTDGSKIKDTASSLGNYCRCGGYALSKTDTNVNEQYCCNGYNQSVTCEQYGLNGHIHFIDGRTNTAISADTYPELDFKLFRNNPNRDPVNINPNFYNTENRYYSYNPIINEGSYILNVTVKYNYRIWQVLNWGSAEAAITLNDATTTNNFLTQDLTLVGNMPGPILCQDEWTTPTITATNSKCEKEFNVSWTFQCQNKLSSGQAYLIRRTSSTDPTIKQWYFSKNDPAWMIDRSQLLTDTEYNYSVQVLGLSTHNYAETEAETGPDECYDPSMCNRQFCDDKDKVRCTQNNFIEPAACTETGAMCIEYGNPPESVCVEPRDCKNLYLNNNPIVNPYPVNGVPTPNLFGFYYYINPQYRQNACYNSMTGSQTTPNYCYYDIYNYDDALNPKVSMTSTDACISCTNVTSCLDYNSRGACEGGAGIIGDYCGVAKGECEWYTTTDNFQGLGKGYCVDTGETSDDYCGECGSGNPNIFQKTGCSAELCRNLGACFAENTGCASCFGAQQATCYDYKDEIACKGIYALDFELELLRGSLIINHHDIYQNDVNNPYRADLNGDGTVSLSEMITYLRDWYYDGTLLKDPFLPFKLQEDSCGLDTCGWNPASSSCFKDGNLDGADDCNDYNDQDCQEDNNRPLTTLVAPQYISLQPNWFNFTTTDPDGDTSVKLFYCFGYNCNPGEGENMSGTHANLIVNENTTGLLQSIEADGYTYLRYRSIDSHKNWDSTKTLKIYTDVIRPNITLNADVVDNLYTQDTSDILITFTTDEDVVCTDKLNSTKLAQDLNKLTSVRVIAGTQVSVNFTNLIDGTYYYTLECKDDVDNLANIIGDDDTKIRIKLERILGIQDISPTYETNPAPIYNYRETVPLGLILNETENENYQCNFSGTGGLRGPFIASHPYYNSSVYLTPSASPQLPEGEYLLNISCQNAGTGAFLDAGEFNFALDNTTPNTIFYLNGIVAEEDEFYLQPGTRVSLGCEGQDFSNFDHASANDCNKTFYCNMSASVPGTCTPNKEVISNGIIEVFILPGYSHKFCYQSRDVKGNLEPLRCKTLRTDSSSPRITITSPTNRYIFKDDIIPLIGFIEDEESPIDYALVTVTNGSGNSSSFYITGLGQNIGRHDFSIYAPIPSKGMNTIRVKAGNKIGQMNMSSVTVYKDQDAPKLLSYSIVDEEGQMDLEYEYNQNLTANVTINDTNYTAISALGQNNRVILWITSHETTDNANYSIYDMDKDGDVDEIDYQIVSDADGGSPCASPTTGACDVDRSGTVTASDAQLVANAILFLIPHYNHTYLKTYTLSNVSNNSTEFFKRIPADPSMTVGNYTARLVAYDSLSNYNDTAINFTVIDSDGPEATITVYDYDTTPWTNVTTVTKKSYIAVVNFSEPIINPSELVLNLTTQSGTKKDFFSPPFGNANNMSFMFTLDLEKEQYTGIENPRAMFGINGKNINGVPAIIQDPYKYIAIDSVGPNAPIWFDPAESGARLRYVLDPYTYAIGFAELTESVELYWTNINANNNSININDWTLVESSTIPNNNNPLFNITPSGSITIIDNDTIRLKLAQGIVVAAGGFDFATHYLKFENNQDNPQDATYYHIGSVSTIEDPAYVYYTLNLGTELAHIPLSSPTQKITVYPSREPNGKFRFDITQLTSGNNYFRAWPKDWLGNIGTPSSTVKVVYDTADITFSQLRPADRQITNFNRTNISLVINGSLTPMNISTLYFEFNGSQKTGIYLYKTCNTVNIPNSCQVWYDPSSNSISELPNGEYSAYARISDTHVPARSESIRWNFTIDSSVPNPKLYADGMSLNHTKMIYTNDPVTEVQVDFEDTNYNHTITKLEITGPGGYNLDLLGDGILSSYDQANQIFNFTIPIGSRFIGDGNYNFEISGVKLLTGGDISNESYDLLSMAFDRTPPKITLSISEEESGIVDNETINLIVGYAENSPMEKISFGGNISAVGNFTSFLPGQTSIQQTLTLTGIDGTKTISVKAYDAAGNVNDTVIKQTILNRPTVIQLISPPNNRTTTPRPLIQIRTPNDITQWCNLSYSPRVQNSSGEIVSILGSTSDHINYDFQIERQFRYTEDADSITPITVECMDEYDVRKSKTFEIIVDNHTPELIEVSLMNNGLFLGNDSLNYNYLITAFEPLENFATIHVKADESVFCWYNLSVDGAFVWTANLSTSFGDTHDKVVYYDDKTIYDYNIFCLDYVGFETQRKNIHLIVNKSAIVNITLAKPFGTIGQRSPQLEVHTFTAADCYATVTAGQNVFAWLWDRITHVIALMHPEVGKHIHTIGVSSAGTGLQELEHNKTYEFSVTCKNAENNPSILLIDATTAISFTTDYVAPALVITHPSVSPYNITDPNFNITGYSDASGVFVSVGRAEVQLSNTTTDQNNDFILPVDIHQDSTLKVYAKEYLDDNYINQNMTTLVVNAPGPIPFIEII
ncbi:MAG: dockerin type I domain-containing protein [Candidatus Woesearchaeota archaeon]